ncbi:hypothetical protein BX265_6217 [Streptomyces sp. TLI_235]|nr:hypothetical protein BX265_6217 [Streptomyces sp. TLI_235]
MALASLDGAEPAGAIPQLESSPDPEVTDAALPSSRPTVAATAAMTPTSLVRTDMSVPFAKVREGA